MTSSNFLCNWLSGEQMPEIVACPDAGMGPFVTTSLLAGQSIAKARIVPFAGNGDICALRSCVFARKLHLGADLDAHRAADTQPAVTGMFYA